MPEWYSLSASGGARGITFIQVFWLYAVWLDDYFQGVMLTDLCLAPVVCTESLTGVVHATLLPCCFVVQGWGYSAASCAAEKRPRVVIPGQAGLAGMHTGLLALLCGHFITALIQA